MSTPRSARGLLTAKQKLCQNPELTAGCTNLKRECFDFSQVILGGRAERLAQLLAHDKFRQGILPLYVSVNGKLTRQKKGAEFDLRPRENARVGWVS
jgi:hypothetical protein